MSNVNLNLYRVFCKVAESNSYSEASKKLNLSPANISVNITNLENQLELKLFNRENKGVTLTEDGKELYEIVNRSISGFDFVEKMAKDKNNIASGKIKIGCPSHFTYYFLMEKIERAKIDFPKLNITIICEVDINKMVDLLKNHKIDFIITDVNIEEKNIENEEIMEMNNIFVSKTPLTIVDIKELESLMCILNSDDTRTTRNLKKVLKENNVDIKADIICDATEIRVDAVKRNMGIAYVIKEAVKKELNDKELFEVQLPIELPKVNLNLVYLKGELSRVDKKFIKDYLKK